MYGLFSYLISKVSAIFLIATCNNLFLGNRHKFKLFLIIEPVVFIVIEPQTALHQDRLWFLPDDRNSWLIGNCMMIGEFCCWVVECMIGVGDWDGFGGRVDLGIVLVVSVADKGGFVVVWDLLAEWVEFCWDLGYSWSCLGVLNCMGLF